MEPSEGTYVHFDFKVATANALTLKYVKQKRFDQGLSGVTRLESILRQCHEASIHIVAFQETRLQRLFGQSNPYYHLHHAAATKQGHFGIIIGFSKQLPFAMSTTDEKAGVPLYFMNDKIALVSSTPRWLILHLRQPWLQCLVIGYHGPHTQASDEEAQSWWHELHKAIPHKLRDLPRVALGDANGHLGDIPSQAVQSYQSETQDRNGELFHKYLLDNDLWLPASSPTHQCGPGGTWRHRQGHLLRNDYVALPQAWKHLYIRAYVDTKVDLTLKHEDHLVAACEVQGQGFYTTPTTTTQPEKFFLPPQQEVKDSLRRIAATLPEVPWQADPTTHDEILTSTLMHHMSCTLQRAKKKPYKPSISSETWQLILKKRAIRNQLQEFSRQERLARMRQVFQSWKQVPEPQTFEEIRSTLVHRHYLHFHFQRLGMLVSDAIQRDDQIFYENLAEEGRQATIDKDYKKIWQLVRRQLPKFKQRRAARNPLTLAVLEDQWLPHFQDLEIGHTISSSALEADYAERTAQHVPQIVPRDALPTLNQVERALRGSQPRKAAGPEGLQPEVLSFAAADLAPAVWDLMTKVFLTQTEPLQWKNGTMIPIHKKGREDLASQYRGILLAAVLGKRFHSLVRTLLMNQLQPFRSSGQIGGFPHGEVLFGSQSLRVAAHIASFQQRPSVTLFLDLRHAFHHVIRELIVGQTMANPFEIEVVLNHLHKDGIDIKGILQWLRHPGVLQRLGSPAYLTQLVDEIHRDTHFRIPQQPQTTKTTRGSRPGSPIADSMFHTIMLDLHHEVERVVEQEDDHVATCRQLGLETLPITWADDMALMLVASANELVIPMVARVTERLSDVFQRRGFLLNLDFGKTGAVISFKGPDAPHHRKQLLLQDRPGCEILQNGVPQRLHFSAVYTHLGTFFEMEGGLRAEIKRRIGLGTSAFHQLRKQIFANRHLQVEIRLQLYESLVASKMWFGSGTWGQIPPQLLKTLDAATMRMIRTIVGEARSSETSATNDELRSLYGIPSARVRICRDRLLYAGRLYRWGPSFLWKLLEREEQLTPDSWTHYLKEDLAWLQRVLPTDERWPRSWDALKQYWSQDGRQWNRIVSKAFRYHLRQESIMLDAQQWHMRCYRLWKSAGVSLIEDPFGAFTTPEGFPCHCGRQFQTHRALRVHQTRLHNYSAPEKHLATSAICPVCQRYFWTRKRMQQHLAYAPRDGGPNQCYEALRLRPPLTSDATVDDDLPAVHALFHRKHALPVEGPPGLGATQQYLDLQECLDQLQALEEEAQKGGFLHHPTEEQYMLWKYIFEKETTAWYALFCGPEQHSECLQSLWLEAAMKHDAPDHAVSSACLYAWGQNDMDDFLSAWEHPSAIAEVEDQYSNLMQDLDIARFYQQQAHLHRRIRFLSQEPEPPSRAHRDVYRGPANDTERRRAQQPVPQEFEKQTEWRATFGRLRAGSFPPTPTVPICRSPNEPPYFILLHLFAGRRREDDWHSHLSRLAAQKNLHLVVLSLDTAIHGDLCNLHCRAVPWRNIMTLLEQGKICGMLAGAPCETFSEARHTPTESGRPRPLRSADRLWGLSGLAWKELGQLFAGGQFSLQVHWAMLQLYKQGGFAVSEHPGPPKDQSRATVWIAEPVQLMLQDQEAFHLTIVQQWRWGAQAVKPTGLLNLRLPSLREDMNRWQLNNPVRPQWQAIGYDSELGCFRTAALKEYPALFSKGLASAFIQAISKVARTGHLREESMSGPQISVQVERWYDQVRVACTKIDAQATWLPDFQADKQTSVL